jgi:hypothetical protein
MAKPDQGTIFVLPQLCKLIPPHLAHKLARKHGCDKRARTFSPWSHVCTMLYSQLSHSLSLNDLCDDLRMQSGKLITARSATPPARNTHSHANKVRSSGMAEELFWSVLSHYQTKFSNFGMERRYCGIPHRFKRTITAIDSTTIELIANCMDWAKHRKRKAAAKVHLGLSMNTFLPRTVTFDSAKPHDSRKAAELCAPLKAGEIAVFDMAYLDTDFLHDLTKRKVYWVSRLKENIGIETVAERPLPRNSRIIEDHIIRFSGDKTSKNYPETLRKVAAVVEVNGKDIAMEFLTNNVEWSATSIAELYKCRWGIEVFFKEIKQTLKLADFLGNSANAVQWQVWTALLAYLLLRLAAYMSKWKFSFRRLFTITRAVMWERYNLIALLSRFSHGTARAPPKLKPLPRQAYFPGFDKGDCQA